MPNIPVSIIMKIIEKFLLEENNANIIYKYISSYYNGFNRATVNKILEWVSHAIAHYLKDIYRLHILVKNNGGSNINIDESMFTHINGEKIWVVGAINFSAFCSK